LIRHVPTLLSLSPFTSHIAGIISPLHLSPDSLFFLPPLFPPFPLSFPTSFVLFPFLRKMNRLPPELLNQIVEDCAPYGASQTDNWNRRSVLSSLCRVNRQFRSIAQPLLPRVITLRSWRAQPILKEKELCQRVWSCDYNGMGGSQHDPANSMHLNFSTFSSLRELRISWRADEINSLSGHQSTLLVHSLALFIRLMKLSHRSETIGA